MLDKTNLAYFSKYPSKKYKIGWPSQFILILKVHFSVKFAKNNLSNISEKISANFGSD